MDGTGRSPTATALSDPSGGEWQALGPIGMADGAGGVEHARSLSATCAILRTAAGGLPSRPRADAGTRRYHRLCFLVVPVQPAEAQGASAGLHPGELRSASVADDDAIPADGASAFFTFSAALGEGDTPMI